MSEISSGNNRKIEVSFTPLQFPVYYKSKDCVVVVIDVFRATSAICAAFEAGIKELITVETVQEAQNYKDQGYLVGAERKAEIVEGFDFGNSPLTFTPEKFADQTIVLTTTNGTKAVEVAKDANTVVIGSFTNISALCEFIERQDKDVILLCAGWKERFNLEDTMFAGAVAKRLSENLRFSDLSDSAIASMQMYEAAKDDMYGFLGNSSHRKRLSRLNLEEDIIYCLTLDNTDKVPVLEDGRFVCK